MSNLSTPLLSVHEAKKHYSVKKSFREKATVKALDGVSFSLNRGETLAIVGESGCGKSTLAKFLMRLETPTAGDYLLENVKASEFSAKDFYRQIQMIFQDPYSSINPRKKAWQIISEPLMVNTELSTEEAKAKAIEMMTKVGLRADYANRYPHMFSGGQRQRIGIARALILNPKVIICDEPVSALDVSVQAQVLNLLVDLQREMNLSYIFISHDLGVVEHVADKVLVMYLGKVVEYGTREAIFNSPKHPYTKALLASTPSITPGEWKFKPLEGELPSPLNPPPGCPFHKRCPDANEKCSKIVPHLLEREGRIISCHLYEE